MEIPEPLRRTAHTDEEAWLESARQLIDLVCRECGLEDLSATAVLDVGCGTKITKVLQEDAIPIRRYVGVDVNRDVIALLDANVDDPRFEFHHIDVQNDLYNPDGLPLAERTELPVGQETFDVIWLFSVFTHLAPPDYVAMLRLLRRYIKRDGWLVFSVFINTVTDTGIGPLDWRAKPLVNTETEQEQFARALEHRVAEEGDTWFADELASWLAVVDEPTRAEVERKLGLAAGVIQSASVDTPTVESSSSLFVDESRTFRTTGEPPDFVDLIPHKPLMQPLYSRRHAFELIEGTGWDVVALNPPQVNYIQHYFVCRPA